MIAEQVQTVLDKIRPALIADGGDVDIVKIDEETGIIYLRLKGACDTCPMSVMTLKGGIEQIMKRELPWVNSVEAV